MFGFIGLLTNFLAFIALFVWIGAAQEASAAQVKSAFAGTPIRAAMLTDFQMLGPSGTLAGAVNLILQGWQQDFPAVEQSGAIGILTPTDLLVVLPQHRRIVTSIMRRDFLTVDRAEMLETVPAPGRMRLSHCACPTNDPKALAPNGVPRHSAA